MDYRFGKDVPRRPANHKTHQNPTVLLPAGGEASRSGQDVPRNRGRCNAPYGAGN